ncbi:unnamed protein product [Gordionus sp. m RMFG-2023]
MEFSYNNLDAETINTKSGKTHKFVKRKFNDANPNKKHKSNKIIQNVEDYSNNDSFIYQDMVSDKKLEFYTSPHYDNSLNGYYLPGTYSSIPEEELNLGSPQSKFDIINLVVKELNPVQRNAANARERARMRVLSKAFIRLKTTLPWVPPDTKLSKLDTLRLASSYIAHLRSILQEDDNQIESDSLTRPIDNKHVSTNNFDDDNKDFLDNDKIKDLQYQLKQHKDFMLSLGMNMEMIGQPYNNVVSSSTNTMMQSLPLVC